MKLPRRNFLPEKPYACCGCYGRPCIQGRAPPCRHPVGICGDDFAAHIRKQGDEYGHIIREANIKAE
jgi:hypothetical protein